MEFNCKELNFETATTQMSPHTLQGRYRDGQSPSVLDLVLSTEVNMVKNLTLSYSTGKE